jgi:hypothetical protein
MIHRRDGSSVPFYRPYELEELEARAGSQMGSGGMNPGANTAKGAKTAGGTKTAARKTKPAGGAGAAGKTKPASGASAPGGGSYMDIEDNGQSYSTATISALS